MTLILGVVKFYFRNNSLCFSFKSGYATHVVIQVKHKNKKCHQEIDSGKISELFNGCTKITYRHGFIGHMTMIQMLVGSIVFRFGLVVVKSPVISRHGFV